MPHTHTELELKWKEGPMKVHLNEMKKVHVVGCQATFKFLSHFGNVPSVIIIIIIIIIIIRPNQEFHSIYQCHRFSFLAMKQTACTHPIKKNKKTIDFQRENNELRTEHLILAECKNNNNNNTYHLKMFWAEWKAGVVAMLGVQLMWKSK